MTLLLSLSQSLLQSLFRLRRCLIKQRFQRRVLERLLSLRVVEYLLERALQGQRFPVGGGINGLAAATGEAVWSRDYRADARWPQ